MVIDEKNDRVYVEIAMWHDNLPAHAEHPFSCLEANSCQFRCNSDDSFLKSLMDDDYNGWIALQSDRKIEMLEKVEVTVLTSIYNTGFIYYEETNSYYSVSVHYVDDINNIYEVVVRYCPKMFIQNEHGEVTKVING